MIDFLEIHVPYLVLPADAGGSAFQLNAQPDGTHDLLFNGQLLARCYGAERISAGDGGRIVRRHGQRFPLMLMCAEAFNRTEHQDDAYVRYRQGLECLLRSQRRWTIQCESECDQLSVYPLERGVDPVLGRLDGLHDRPALSVAFSSTGAKPRTRTRIVPRPLPAVLAPSMAHEWPLVA